MMELVGRPRSWWNLAEHLLQRHFGRFMRIYVSCGYLRSIGHQKEIGRRSAVYDGLCFPRFRRIVGFNHRISCGVPTIAVLAMKSCRFCISLPRRDLSALESDLPDLTDGWVEARSR